MPRACFAKKNIQYRQARSNAIEHVEKDVDIVLHGLIQQQNDKQHAPMAHSILSSCRQHANSRQHTSQWRATRYNDTLNIDKHKATNNYDKCINVCFACV